MICSIKLSGFFFFHNQFLNLANLRKLLFYKMIICFNYTIKQYLFVFKLFSVILVIKLRYFDEKYYFYFLICGNNLKIKF